ncbi:unnamed protein product, partial [Polarella glacialis]
EDSLQVLTVATGTRCIGVGAMMSGKGCVVHDCHAEVLCRRAFQRYLLAEMAGGEGGSGILQRSGSGTSLSWRVRPGVQLHFYVSTLPCGECALAVGTIFS